MAFVVLLVICLAAPAFAGEVGIGETVPIHTVSIGETLSGIAREYTGDASRWEELRKENGLPQPAWKHGKQVVKIRPGQKLILPAGWFQNRHLEPWWSGWFPTVRGWVKEYGELILLLLLALIVGRRPAAVVVHNHPPHPPAN